MKVRGPCFVALFFVIFALVAVMGTGGSTMTAAVDQPGSQFGIQWVANNADQRSPIDKNPMVGFDLQASYSNATVNHDYTVMANCGCTPGRFMREEIANDKTVITSSALLAGLTRADDNKALLGSETHWKGALNDRTLICAIIDSRRAGLVT